MQLLNHKKLHIVAGRATQELATAICRELDVPLGSPNIEEFANGEIHVEVGLALQYPAEFVIINVSQWTGGSNAVDTL